MNSNSMKLLKPGDVLVHLETGEPYKLLSIGKRTYRRKMSGPIVETDQIVYTLLDIKTDQEMEYTRAMVRDRLKYASPSAQILYTDKEGQIKTGRENVEG